MSSQIISWRLNHVGNPARFGPPPTAGRGRTAQWWATAKRQPPGAAGSREPATSGNNIQSSMAVRSVNSGGPSTISVMVALATFSPSGRRGSFSRSRAFASLSTTTRVITRLGSFMSRVVVVCTRTDPGCSAARNRAAIPGWVGQAWPAYTAHGVAYPEPVPTWFLRHGESQANAAGVFAGQGVDSPLTVVGRNQARHAAASVPTEVEWIVASPLARSTETAEIVRQIRGVPSRVEIDHRAIEYDVGSASGLPTQPMTATEMVDRFGAEDPDEFAARVRSLLDDLSEREGGGLLVSHAGVGRMIHTLRQGREPSGFRDQSLPENAALFLI